MARHPGKFVWFELNTKNFDKAKKFYGELFGWKIETASMGAGEYQLVKNGGEMIGGLVPLQGDHPHWLSYLSVEDVDKTVGKVKKNGGKLVREAMDYPTVGRFALVSDPQGGLLYAFKAEKDDADDRDTKHGDWFWNELWTSDADKASKFYQETFGFSGEAMEMPGMKYHVLKAEGVHRGGIMTSPVPGIPVNWLPYVRVDDVDGLAKRAQKLGGSVMSEPQDIPNVGRFAIIKDPDGAAIGTITPSNR